MRRAPFTHSPETTAGSAALPGRWSFLSCLRNVEVWLGFAALLFLVRGMLAFEGALRGDPGGDTIRAVEESEGVLDALQTPFFLGALFSSGACLLVLGLLAARRPRVGAAIRSPRAWLPASAVLAVSSTAGALLSAANSVPAPSASLCLGALWGACLAAVLLAWGCLLAEFELQHALVLAAVAVGLQWAPFPALLFLGAAGRAALVGAAATVATACLAKASLEFAPIPNERDEAPGDGQGTRPGRGGAGVARIALAAFLFAGVMQYALTLIVKKRLAGLWPADLALVFLVVALTSLAVFFAVLVLMGRRNEFRVEVVWRVTFVLAACAGTAVALAPYNMLLSYALACTGSSVVFSTTLLLATAFAFSTSAPAAAALGTTCGAAQLGQFAGFALQLWLGSLDFAGGGPLLALSCLGGAGVLAVAFAFVLPDASVTALLPRPPAMVRPSVEGRCAELAATFGLTEREADILPLLARGRNASHVAETLALSRNTVATHRKNIYRKLGVHSQQELLSLVDDGFGGGAKSCGVDA